MSKTKLARIVNEILFSSSNPEVIWVHICMGKLFSVSLLQKIFSKLSTLERGGGVSQVSGASPDPGREVSCIVILMTSVHVHILIF